MGGCTYSRNRLRFLLLWFKEAVQLGLQCHLFSSVSHPGPHVDRSCVKPLRQHGLLPPGALNGFSYLSTEQRTFGDCRH